MKLAELLNVDTTKENWFKLLSKKGINPKTVNAVSKGGGEGGEVKEYYYKVLSHINDQGASPLLIFRQFGIALINTCIFEGNKITYRQYTHNGDTSVTSAMEYVYNEDNRVQAFSFLDIETYILSGDLVGAFPKGTLYDRAYYIVESYSGTEEEKAQMKEFLNTMYLKYFQEITKEEYESLITQ